MMGYDAQLETVNTPIFCVLTFEIHGNCTAMRLEHLLFLRLAFLARRTLSQESCSCSNTSEDIKSAMLEDCTVMLPLDTCCRSGLRFSIWTRDTFDLTLRYGLDTSFDSGH